MAALIVVDGILDGVYTPNTKTSAVSKSMKPKHEESYDQTNTAIAFSKIEDWKLLQASSKEIWKQASELLKNKKVDNLLKEE